MTVYVVMSGVDYLGFSVYKIFQDEQKAERCADEADDRHVVAHEVVIK